VTDAPDLFDKRLRIPRLRDDDTISPDAVPEEEIARTRDLTTPILELLEQSEGRLRRALDALYDGNTSDIEGLTDHELADLMADSSSEFRQALYDRFVDKSVGGATDSAVAQLVRTTSSATRQELNALLGAGGGVPGVPAIYEPTGPLSEFRIDLAGAKTRQSRILIQGDSLLEGTRQSSTDKRVINVLGDLLRTHLGLTGDYDYLPGFYEFERVGEPPAGQGISWNTAMTASRISTARGLGRRARKMLAGDVATITRKATSLKAALYFPDTTAVVRIKLDGVDVATLGPGLSGSQVWDSNVSSESRSRTLVITRIDGEPWLEGVEVNDGSDYAGLLIADGSKHGSMAWQFNGARDTNGVGHMDAVTRFNADLVVLGHITNDFKYANETAATWKLSTQKNIDLHRSRNPGVSIAIFLPWQVAGSPAVAGQTWAMFRAKAEELVKENVDTELWDMSAVVTDKTGLIDGDGIHWNDAGAKLAAEFLFGKITENGKLGGTTSGGTPITTPATGAGSYLTPYQFGFDPTPGADNTKCIDDLFATAMRTDGAAVQLPAAEISVKYLRLDYSTQELQAASGRPYGYAGPVIMGMGTGKTIFRRIAGYEGPFFKIQGRTGSQAGPGNNNKIRSLSMRDFSVDLRGIGSAAFPAIYLRSILNSSFTDIWVIDAPGDGFYFAREISGYNSGTVNDEYNHGNYFTGCKVLVAKGVGFADAGTTSIGRTMIGCEAQSVGGGFWLTPTSTTIIAGRVFGSTGPALRARRNTDTVSSNTGLRVMGFRAEQCARPGKAAVEIESGHGYELAGMEYYSTQGEDCLELGMTGDGTDFQQHLRAIRITGGIYGVNRNKYPESMAIRIGPNARESIIELGHIQYSGGFIRPQDYIEDNGVRTTWIIPSNVTQNLDGSVTVLRPLTAHPAPPVAGAVKEYVLLEGVAPNQKLARYHLFATGDPVREWIQP
jgi:hypothetical protein